METSHEILTDIAASADDVAAVLKREQRAISKAKEGIEAVIRALMAHHDIGFQAAVAKLRRANLSNEELGKLVAKVKQPKPRLAQPDGKPDDREPDDDPDDKLTKLGEAIQRACPNAKFTKAGAAAWAAENTEEGRSLVRASKQQSLNRYNPAYDGFFTKLGGHPIPSTFGGHDGENTRRPRPMTADYLTDVNAADSLITFPIDERDDGATKARKTAAAIQGFMDQGYTRDAAASKVLQAQKQARGW